MNDPFVHFRYHDGVNALIGTHMFRYERMRLSEVEGAITYLKGRGYDDFCIRLLNSQEPWHVWIAPHVWKERHEQLV